MPSFAPDKNSRGLTRGQFVDCAPFLMPRSKKRFDCFFEAMQQCIERTEASGAWSGREDWKHETGASVAQHGGRILAKALDRMQREFVACHKRGNQLILVGNGGSAAIASHMAVDFTKNGGIRARALNDAATLTCFANDFGYENVFARQLEAYARKGDIVVIISSSGRSPNVLRTAVTANKLGLDSVRLTGMDPDNALRRGGRLNLYVPCGDYGLVELTHMALLHSVVSCAKPVST
jgi:D-sedoheptulose 7-phosphate isomerase